MPRGEKMQRLTDAERDEAEKHIPLNIFLVKKLGKITRGLEFDDQLQEGMLGVMASVVKHDPAKSKFSTYARQAVRTYVTKADMDNKFIRVPQYLYYDTEHGKSVRKYVESLPKVKRMESVDLGQQRSVAREAVDKEARDREDASFMIHEAMKVLSDQERYIIKRLYFDGLTLRVLSKEMHLSPCTLRVRRGVAIQKMRERLLEAV